ncbi:hypothetical protein [Paenarthrobacter sp. CAP02]|uniref:hypothetical protein n=1 Tax=Paenarthrobacter sp. CAP02 TaxID=3158144 RepID=UPI0032DABD10
MNDSYFEITYFSDGTMPLKKRFDDEPAARAFWDDVNADPYKSASSLVRVEVLETR